TNLPVCGSVPKRRNKEIAPYGLRAGDGSSNPFGRATSECAIGAKPPPFLRLLSTAFGATVAQLLAEAHPDRRPCRRSQRRLTLFHSRPAQWYWVLTTPRPSRPTRSPNQRCPPSSLLSYAAAERPTRSAHGSAPSRW